MFLDIIQDMNRNGLHPDKIICDGNIHRFKADASDKGTAGWYSCYQHYASDDGGAPYQVVVYGNFKTGDKFTYQNNKTATSAKDKKEQAESIKKAQEQHEKIKKEQNEKAAKECQERWPTYSEELNRTFDYLVRKKIDKLYGARIATTLGNNKIYVPMKDIDGVLHSIQSIDGSTGDKQFYPGGRKKGCFHLIGDLAESEELVICEGFATGVSIHQATKLPVVVAFDSGNLKEVATLLRRKYSDYGFIIAGDDDVYTVHPITKEPMNPGREAATEAAKASLGVAQLPVFKNPRQGLTDFNDLAVEEGLEAVKLQLLKEKPKKSYILPLGYDSGTYYFISNQNPQIQKMSSSAIGASSGLLRLQPLEYWQALYPSRSGDGVSWLDAANNLMDKCHIKGVFKPDNIRGVGAWHENGEFVYHLGNQLYVKNKYQNLHKNNLDSDYIYDLGEKMPKLSTEPLTLAQCEKLLNISNLINWTAPESGVFFLGWLVVSQLGGYLQWRPHAWLSGPSGSGKSYIMENIVKTILEGHFRYFIGSSTEAGIRQTVKKSSLPVIFDEFETNDANSHHRVGAVLELARQASSDSSGIVVKGTADGAANEFKAQFAMLAASVRASIIHEEDENRFTMLELRRNSSRNADQFEKLNALVVSLTDEYGDQLRARIFKNADKIKASAKILQKIVALKLNARLGQQYGTLLAGYWSLSSDEVITQDQAQRLVSSIELHNAKKTMDRSDEQECLNHLLDHIMHTETNGVRVEGSIREMIYKHITHSPTSDPFGGPKYLDSLERLGISVKKSDDETKYELRLHLKNVNIKNIYKNSQWVGSFDKQMTRIDGAKQSVITKFTHAGTVNRCLSIDLDTIFKDISPAI